MRGMTDAAVALFSEEGYSGVSTRRIAERAGCSETLLFRYFGDKRGLLLAICNGLAGNADSVRTAHEFNDVREFLEHYFTDQLANLRRQSSSLKVVIAALINDPEMTADFESRHDAAVQYVADNLQRFQDRGAIAADIDVQALAQGIEQLGFAVGFLLQLVFDRPEKELVAIAMSCAGVLSQGLQADAPQPLLEPRRRKAVAAVLDAREQLDTIIDLLEDRGAEDGGQTRPRRPRRALA